MYSTSESKWNAFRFKDPFASDAFCVCHHLSKTVCRPNCDMGIQDLEKKNFFFTDTYIEATNQGFHPCTHCFPDRQLSSAEIQKGTYVSIDLNLLVQTVIHVNQEINFIPPLMREENEKTFALKESIWKSENTSLKKRLLSGFSGRSNSTAGGLPIPKSLNDFSLTRNEFDHLKIIDLACRHIALAALSTTDNASVLECFESSPDSSSKSKIIIASHVFKKKRRRGGVLGFKELASKSSLSPWHFHRVFKSVTGLTPKNYGDKCFEYIRDYERLNPSEKFNKSHSVIIDSKIANPTLANEEEEDVTSSTTNTEVSPTVPNNSTMDSTPVANISSTNARIRKKPSFSSSKRRKSKSTRISGETLDISKLERDLNRNSLQADDSIRWLNQHESIGTAPGDSSNFSVGSSPTSIFSVEDPVASSKPSLIKRDSWSTTTGDAVEKVIGTDYKLADELDSIMRLGPSFEDECVPVSFHDPQTVNPANSFPGFNFNDGLYSDKSFSVKASSNNFDSNINNLNEGLVEGMYCSPIVHSSQFLDFQPTQQHQQQIPFYQNDYDLDSHTNSLFMNNGIPVPVDNAFPSNRELTPTGLHFVNPFSHSNYTA